MPLGVTQAVDIKKIKLWDKVTPLYTEGIFAGKEVSREGDSPYEFMYREAIDGTTFHDGPTEWATFLPGVYNADTLGIRPDLSAARSPAGATCSIRRVQGQGGDPEHPDDRHHGRDHGLRVRRASSSTATRATRRRTSSTRRSPS